MNFDIELNNISREILDLKSQHQVAPENLSVVSQSVDLEFELELYDFGGGEVGRSQNMALVLLETNGNNPLVGVEYNIDELGDVEIRDVPYYDVVSKKIGRMIYVIDNNVDDILDLKNGNSVSLSYSINILTTSEVDIEVVYNDLWVN